MVLPPCLQPSNPRKFPFKLLCLIASEQAQGDEEVAKIAIKGGEEKVAAVWICWSSQLSNV
ncbi:hypothetical protein EGR_08232 [Echinococcus granulosus]|uniref:Uncharacterized protein n=1 Tax=Echinococcus granulosus TaxID=6210 RepID=W6U8V7_ECHGR|nr:hypothetical protein EGR_08232 [Echinococcus granulosus]EUB56926.1 hypothetical protein EGR_08232 [Echinococcus granulosus]